MQRPDAARRSICGLILALGMAMATTAQAQYVPAPAGTTEWRFNNLTGGVIAPAFGPGVMSQQNLPGGTTDGIYSTGATLAGDVIPTINGGAGQFLYTSAAAGHFGTNTGYRVFSNVDGPLSGHRQFTMVYDMYIPSTTTQSGFVSLYQGNATNGNDVDGYLRLANRNMWYGGAANQYDFGEWTRLALAVDYDANTARTYVDGSLVSTGTVGDYVYDAGNGLPFWIFSDDSGDHKPTAWANFAFVPDVALDGATIASLGSANAAGVFNTPEPTSMGIWAALAGIGVSVLAWRKRRAAKTR